MALARRPGNTPDRGNSHNRAVLIVHQIGQRGLNGIKHAAQIAVHHIIPVVIGQITEHFLLRNTSVAHHSTHRSQHFMNAVHTFLHVLTLGHVRLNGQCAGLSRQRFGLFGAAAIAERDLPTVLYKGADSCGSNAP